MHADDVAEAYRLAILAPGAGGAYNVASAPVLDMPSIAASRGARTVRRPHLKAQRAHREAETAHRVHVAQQLKALADHRRSGGQAGPS